MAELERVEYDPFAVQAAPVPVPVQQQRLEKVDFDPFNQPSKQYNYIPPQDGKDEKILFQQTGETISAPAGTGQFFSQVANDGLYNVDATVTEEMSAQFEEIAGNMAIMARAFNLTTDDRLIDYAVDRKKALASARLRQPEYMDSFFKQWNNANTVLGAASVLMSNPQALGRMVLTQSPNSALPLITSYIGAKGGAAIGAGGALVAGQTGPQVAVPEEIVTVPLAAAGGAIIGGGVGTFTGTAMMEAAGEMDTALRSLGYNPESAVSVKEALNNENVKAEIRRRAASRGITVGAVEGLFQAFGGHYLKGIEKSGLLEKSLKYGANVLMESGGEAGGSIAGDIATGEAPDFKGAALEAIASLTQSVGQTTISATTMQGKKIVGKEKPQPANQELVNLEKSATDIKSEIGQIEADKQVIIKTGGDAAAVKEKIAALEIKKNDALLRLEKNTQDIEQKRTTIAEFEKSNLANKDEEIRKGRIKKLTDDIKPIDRQLDMLEAKYVEDLKAGNSTKETENKINTLVDKRNELEKERIILKEKILPTNTSQDVTVKGESLNQAEKKAARKRADAVVRGFNEGIKTARTDVKAAQESIINLVKESGLGKEAIGLFEREIREADTSAKAARRLPKVQEKVVALLDERLRSQTIKKIQKSVKKASVSRVIDVGFSQRIQDLVSDIDFTKRTDKTNAKLQSVLDYYQSNLNQKPPKKLIRKLEVLGKKQSGDITTTELLGILDEIGSLIRKGKKKQSIKDMQVKNRLEKRMTAIEGVKKINKFEIKTPDIGERLSVMDNMKNAYAATRNKYEILRISKNPMDVLFDMIDGAVEYTGAAHTVFKKTMDKAFSRYLNLRDETEISVKKILDNGNYTRNNFERIGTYAAVKQEGGMEKLLGMGKTSAEIEKAINLTEDELKLYNAMRAALETLFPKIQKVMQDVYNLDVKAVDDYFPFLTDFSIDSGNEIQDIINRTSVDVNALNRKNVKKDFTKKRTGGKQNIKLNAYEVFSQHVDNATYFIEMAQDIKELSDLASDKRFEDKVGNLNTELISDWLDLLAKKGMASDRITQLDALRKKTGLAVLGFKISSALLQSSALIEGSTLVGADYVGRGFKNVATSSEWRKFLFDNLPEVRDRVGDDPHYLTLQGDTVLSKINEAGFYALKKIDLFAASAVAAGAYEKSVKRRGGVIDFNNPDPIAIEEAQLYMRRTQSSAFAKDQALLTSTGQLTGNSSLDKLIFQFQSFMFNRWSIISHDMVRGGLVKGKTLKAANIATMLILANLFEYGLRELSKEGWAALFGTEIDPWKPDELDEKVALQVLSNVPYVSSAAGIFEYGTTPVPSISVASQAFKEIGYIANSKTTEKQMKHAANSAILLTGIGFGVSGSLGATQIVNQLTKEKKKKSLMSKE